MRFCSFRSADALACDPASETLSAGGKTHVVAELRDAFGRGTGYAYAKAGTVQQTTGARRKPSLMPILRERLLCRR